VVGTFFSITPFLVYLVAGLVTRRGGTLSPGTLVAFTTLQARLFFPIGQMLSVSTDIQSSMALFERIFEYMDMPAEIQDAPDAVQRGAVEIDGFDVRRISLESLGELMGVVTQETYLFHTTVRRNLQQGRLDATQAELEAACRAAFIHDRIMELPDGYDTVVGERGYKLSGGEKQRLAIARVILKDPRILILDEATSSLDTTSERLV